MNIDKERLHAMKLAKAVGAPKTLATLANKDACFESIIRTGMSEVGLDTLVSQVLEGPPMWAQKTLLYVADVGSHRKALINKAAETPESAWDTLRFVDNVGSHRGALLKAAGALAVPAPISKFRLYNEAGFSCQFTLKWIHDNRLMPASEYPSWKNWVWSDEIPVLQNTGIKSVTDFVLADAPIAAGDLVWMEMWIRSGIPDIIDASIQFTYDPNVDPLASTANFVASGTTQSAHLDLRDTTGPDAAARGKRKS